MYIDTHRQNTHVEAATHIHSVHKLKRNIHRHTCTHSQYAHIHLVFTHIDVVGTHRENVYTYIDRVNIDTYTDSVHTNTSIKYRHTHTGSIYRHIYGKCIQIYTHMRATYTWTVYILSTHTEQRTYEQIDIQAAYTRIQSANIYIERDTH